MTGGAGFIGSNLVRYLVKRGYEVIVYDKLTYAGRLENLHDVLRDIVFVRGDIADEESLDSVVRRERPDIVINMAAETHVDRSINEPAPFIQTNVVGLFTLLEVSRKRDIGLFIHTSTDEVYGDLGEGVYADESYPLRPSSPYSASKASGDLLVQAYGRTYGLRYMIVRPSNNYGPYQHPEKLIPRTIVRLVHGLKATVYGDGGQVRDWLYVEDTCRAYETLIKRGSVGQVYNVCGGQVYSVREVVEKIVLLMGRDPVRDIVYVRGRPGEDRRYAMRCEKIRGLGWEPLKRFEEGLRETIEWYLENRWWWGPLADSRYVLSETPW